MELRLEGTITVKTLIAYLKLALKNGDAYSAVGQLIELLENLED